MPPGIPIRQGYGMTEASPVTHMGYLDPQFFRADSIGGPVALTECRVLDEKRTTSAQGELGELVMRGPQIMLGYWKSPDATDGSADAMDGTGLATSCASMSRDCTTWSTAAKR